MLDAITVSIYSVIAFQFAHAVRRVINELPLEAISMYSNHSPLHTVDMTLGGEPIQVHLFRGSKFVDEEGEHVEPLAWLSLQEYKRIVSMLGDEDTERTYPYAWEEAEALLYEWRSEENSEIILD